MAGSLGSATSNKVYYLYFVTFFQRCRGPVCPPHDSAVNFNSQPFSFQPKLNYKVRDDYFIGHIFIISVDSYLQFVPLLK